MRAIEYASNGEPAKVLRLVEKPVPEPRPGQVLVRLQARPINPSDLFQIRGQYGVQPRLPAVAGMEGAGTVAKLGAGVEQFAPGEQVVSLAPVGTWQEYAVADANALMAVPGT
ncbi:alcohol dehydrogenase, partial [Kouleothrix aurantiaca]